MVEGKKPISEDESTWCNTEEANKKKHFEEQIDTTNYEESQIQPTPLIEPEIDSEISEKKRRRRRIYIIVFAIILPIIIVITAVAFLIWGIVVGFTQCIESCENCCNDCFGCCETCESCGNCCSDCSNTCTNCCGSSESINLKTSEAITKTRLSIRLFFNNSIIIIHWIFYRIVQFIQKIFIK